MTRRRVQPGFFDHSILVIPVLLVAMVCRADVIILDDGSRLEGKAHKEGDHWVIVDSAGQRTSVAPDRIKSFELTAGGSGADEQELRELRQTAADLADATVIVDRYEAFLKRHPGGSAAASAKADLAVWRQRLDQGRMKVGSNWLTPDEQAGLASKEAASAEIARDLIRQSRLQQAEGVLRQALADDPADPAALYLQSLLLAEQNQNVAARNDLEQLNKLSAHHAPTLNNLAVILWRQRFYGAALIDYGAAMRAAPGEKTIVDNVAEAMHALPAENRDSAPARGALALFEQQDAMLRQRQKLLGKSRWGATWVASEQLGELELEDESISSQMAAIEDDYQRTQTSVASDEEQINTTQQLLNNGLNQSPLPPDFVQLQQDLQLFTNARQIGLSHLKALDERREKVEHSRSAAKFTGVQRLIGVEGTPIRAQAPATRGSAAGAGG